MGQLSAIWRFRHFWLSLVRMDLLTRYRRSVLGVGWSFLHPLAMAGIFYLVFRPLAPAGDADWWRTYIPQTLVGLAVWEFLRASAVQGCKTFLVHQPYIRQCPLPSGIYPLRVVLSNLVHAAIGLLILAALVFWVAPHGLSWKAGFALPGLVVAAVFAWSLATALAYATIHFNDVAHIVELAAQGLFFLTPIVYPRQNLGSYGWIADLNPFGAVLDLVREPLVAGIVPGLDRYGVAGAWTVAAFGLACAAILRYERRLVFRL